MMLARFFRFMFSPNKQERSLHEYMQHAPVCSGHAQTVRLLCALIGSYGVEFLSESRKRLSIRQVMRMLRVCSIPI
jgi:hypothetical protein